MQRNRNNATNGIFTDQRILVSTDLINFYFALALKVFLLNWSIKFGLKTSYSLVPKKKNLLQCYYVGYGSHMVNGYNFFLHVEFTFNFPFSLDLILSNFYFLFLWKFCYLLGLIFGYGAQYINHCFFAYVLLFSIGILFLTKFF